METTKSSGEEEGRGRGKVGGRPFNAPVGRFSSLPSFSFSFFTE